MLENDALSQENFPSTKLHFLNKVKIALHVFVSNYPVVAKISKIFDHRKVKISAGNRKLNFDENWFGR